MRVTMSQKWWRSGMSVRSHNTTFTQENSFYVGYGTSLMFFLNITKVLSYHMLVCLCGDPYMMLRGVTKSSRYLTTWGENKLLCLLSRSTTTKKSYTKKRTRYSNAGLWRLRCWAACVINNDDGVSFLYPPSERETEKAPEEYCPSPDGFFMSVAYYADRHRHWNRHNNLDPKSLDVSERVSGHYGCSNLITWVPKWKARHSKTRMWCSHTLWGLGIRLIHIVSTH